MTLTTRTFPVAGRGGEGPAKEREGFVSKKRDDLEIVQDEELEPVTITLMQSVKLTNNKIAQRGDVVTVRPGLAAMLVHSTVALEGEHPEIKPIPTEKMKAAAEAKAKGKAAA